MKNDLKELTSTGAKKLLEMEEAQSECEGEEGRLAKAPEREKTWAEHTRLWAFAYIDNTELLHTFQYIDSGW